MAIPAVVDTIEGLEPAVAALYVEVDGAFHLDIDDATLPTHRGVAPLQKTVSATRSERDALKAEKAKLAAQISELEKGAPDTAATQAKMAQLQEQLEALSKGKAEVEAKYRGVTVERALTDALTAGGVANPTFLNAARKLLGDAVKMADDGSIIAETSMGPRMVGDYVKSWLAGDGASFVSQSSGGGASGSKNSGGAAPPKGSLAGGKAERQAALKQRFPDLE